MRLVESLLLGFAALGPAPAVSSEARVPHLASPTQRTQTDTIGAVQLLREVDRLLARGDISRAYGVARHAARENPGSATIQAAAGDAAGTMAGRAPVWRVVPLARQARSHYQVALAADPRNTRALEGWAGYLAQAPRIVGGDAAAAFEIVRALENVDPARGLSARIMLLRHRKAPRAQLDSLVRHGLVTHAGDTLFLERAADYYAATNQWDRAAEVRQILHAQDSSSAARAYRLARSFIQLGELRRAETLLLGAWLGERAANDSGWVGSARVGWQLAVVAARAGQPAAASAWCDSVRQVDPKHAGAIRMLDSLRRTGAAYR